MFGFSGVLFRLSKLVVIPIGKIDFIQEVSAELKVAVVDQSRLETLLKVHEVGLPVLVLFVEEVVIPALRNPDLASLQSSFAFLFTHFANFLLLGRVELCEARELVQSVLSEVRDVRCYLAHVDIEIRFLVTDYLAGWLVQRNVLQQNRPYSMSSDVPAARALSDFGDGVLVEVYQLLHCSQVLFGLNLGLNDGVLARETLETLVVVPGLVAAVGHVRFSRVRSRTRFGEMQIRGTAQCLEIRNCILIFIFVLNVLSGPQSVLILWRIWLRMFSWFSILMLA